MKFNAYFKTPDVLHYTLQDMSKADREDCIAFAAKWIEYDECVCIEFDTEAGTATVKE